MLDLSSYIHVGKRMIAYQHDTLMPELRQLGQCLDGDHALHVRRQDCILCGCALRFAESAVPPIFAQSK
jgi:hypothetical protein